MTRERWMKPVFAGLAVLALAGIAGSVVVAQAAASSEKDDRWLNGNGSFGVLGYGPGPGGWFEDYHQILAEELGISVAELEAAMQTAREAMFQQLVDEGTFTDEQVERFEAAQALRQAIDEDALMANALGISVAALEDAREEGKKLSDILDDVDMDSETFRENLSAAHQAAVDQAVEDGVITQSQAELLQAGPGFGHGFPGAGFHGRGGFHRGGPPGS